MEDDTILFPTLSHIREHISHHLMKQKLDIGTWARKEHFNFFKDLDEPFYGVCVAIDCTKAYRYAKQKGISFNLYLFYQALKATLKVEPLRYRIEGDGVVIYDTLNAGPTIARPNGTFGYGYMEYYASLEEFIAEANKIVEEVAGRTDLKPSAMENMIRFSTLPWIDFTSISHATSFSYRHSCPSISFGKMAEKDGKRSMPMSIHVHHALVDGIHVGQYIDHFQELLNENV